MLVSLPSEENSSKIEQIVKFQDVQRKKKVRKKLKKNQKRT